ncbi:MAG: hypothetical protein H6983_02145 [Ectothiorhodospiraceae bacterium]|nr:hypothetical protein [Ectothiorhodospiraceae bacterium]
MKPTVYLADLRHRYMGVLSTDTMPINVGYMKAVMDRDLQEVRSRLFAYPEPLLAALRTAPPDVLMVSNYMWNEQLSLHVARVAKAVRPETFVVMGGPNIFDDPERQAEFVRAHPEIDLYALGEGDFLATDLVREFLDAGASVERVLQRSLPSSVYVRPDGTVERNEVRVRERNLDDIPSPWLTGIMDEFFDGKLSPLWETNRGCPFTCSFCVQGTGYYNRVTNFGQERLHEELLYMGRMIREHSPAIGMLRIADPNWGMYKRDPVLSDYIAETQRRYRWPTYIDATTGKNRPDRIIESLEKVGGALVFWQAVQSLDEDVLGNIKRENIKLEAYEALQVHMRGRGLKSSSDLILGLPGDSFDSHLRSMLGMIDSGTMKLNNFQCMMLKGTEMERPESRQKFGFDTRYRLICKSFGVYEDQPIFEHDEIIVATDDLPFEDYLRARTRHFACAVFMNHTRLEPLFDLGVRMGVKRSELYLALVQAMERDQGELRALLDDFLQETRSELFESPEAMREFYGRPEIFERVRTGDIGDNLISKVLSHVCLRMWEPVCGLALATARAAFEGRGGLGEFEDFDEIWRDFEQYMLHRYATGSSKERLLAPVHVTVSHDVDQWVHDGFPADVSGYRFPSETRAVFQFSDERHAEIAAAVDTWGLSQQGGTMLIKRIRVGGLERDVSLVAATVA